MYIHPNSNEGSDSGCDEPILGACCTASMRSVVCWVSSWCDETRILGWRDLVTPGAGTFSEHSRESKLVVAITRVTIQEDDKGGGEVELVAQGGIYQP
jgi:hypothetical protein